MSEQVNWLPLIAAQPGIWMADQLSPHSNAYAVAHVVELTGHISLAHLITAIKLGLTEADTLHMVFRETEGRQYRARVMRH